MFTNSNIIIYHIHRTSIFDNNIHKFGDLVIKKSYTEESLSKLIIQSGFGLHDIPQFHQRLSCGGITTKLSQIDTISVIEHIASYYSKLTNTNSKWKMALKKQTSIYNTSLQIEALTTKNLERHNSYLKCLNLIQYKLDDLSMCKDIDEPSVGRASKKSKDKSSRSSVLLERKLRLAKDGSTVSNNSPMQVLASTKAFIDRHGIQMKCHDTDIREVNADAAKFEKNNVNRMLNNSKINIEQKGTHEEFKSAHKDLNYEEKHKNINKLISTCEDVTWEDDHKEFKKSENNTTNEDAVANSIKEGNIFCFCLI